MKPIGKYIIVSQIDETVKTDSGLMLSGEDMNQFRYRCGVVVEPGTDVKHIVKGDKIYYDKAQSFVMMIGAFQYTILRETDVVVVE